MKEGGTDWVGKFFDLATGANLKATLTPTSKTVTITGDYSKLGVEASQGTVVVA